MLNKIFKCKIFFITFLISVIPLFILLSDLSIEAAYPKHDVIIRNIRFLNGVGKGPTHSPPNNLTDNYYRSYGLSGTLIEITAEMDADDTAGTDWRPMYGDVRLTITFTHAADSATFYVTIPSGQNTGTVQIPYNQTSVESGTFNVVSGTTENWEYTVTDVCGLYSNGTIAGNDTESILWDNADVPDSNTVNPFPPNNITPLVDETPTTNSVKLSWNPVDTTTVTFNEDFHEYRVYYREEGNTEWLMWNGTNDSSLSGLTNNPTPAPVSDAVRHFDTSGKKYTTLTNLKIFTSYQYYITAVDVFGNETAMPAVLYTVRTQPYSIMIKISDGIESYSNFNDLSNPALRTLRASNVRVEIFFVSSDTSPDTVKIWYTYNNTATDIVASDNTINESAFPADSLYSVTAEKKGPNKWIAYLSTQTPVVSSGNSVRFIIESGFSGVPVFSDKDLSDEDANDDEWNFAINTPTNFNPWPAKILNNVISIGHPAAYPSYYLTHDANVSIKVFDMKGRPVSTILDKVFRRGGQNIRERGWYGTNKTNSKLGIGLYYIHIHAERTTDGAVILNSFNKVVIKR